MERKSKDKKGRCERKKERKKEELRKNERNWDRKEK